MSGTRAAPAGVEMQVARSVADLDTAAWDALAGDDLYLTSRWLGAVERFFSAAAFLLLRDGRGLPVAGLAAYLVGEEAYLFVDPPRLLVSEPLLAPLAERSQEERGRAGELRAALGPRLAQRYPVAVCVSPFTAAGGVVGAIDRPRVARRLLDVFAEVAGEWGASGSALLSLPERRYPLLAEAAAERGYASTLLGARCSLPVRWQSFDGYLGSLWHKRRREVRSELRAFETSGMEVAVVDGSRLGELLDELAPLFANLQRRYGHGGGVAEARETIDWVRQHFCPLTRVVLIDEAGRTVAFHLLYELDGTLYCYLTGQTYEPSVQEAGAYFQAVYYKPIELAIQWGIRRIDFGNESYEAKLWRGCEPEWALGLFDFGDDLRAELAELVGLVDAAQRQRFGRYARYRRLR